MNFIDLFKKWILGEISPGFFQENRNSIDATNFGLLKVGCTFSACMCLFLLALTQGGVVYDIIGELKILYLVFSVAFIIQTILVFTVVEKRKRLTPIFFYVFAVTIFLLVIDVCTKRSVDESAVTFFIFLIIIPILYVTRPIYSVLMSILVTAFFCFATISIKSDWSYIIPNDILNAVCCCIVGIGVNITILNLHISQISIQSVLKQQSTTDELTGLWNRRQYNVYIDKIFKQCKESGENLYVVMMDVDNFKNYNDYYGHIDGDECLKKVCSAIKAYADKEHIFCARFGGEEFSAIASGYRKEQFDKIAKGFIKAVEDLQIPNCCIEGGIVTISAGYARADMKHEQTYMQVINWADEALYCAKRAGKNTCVSYNISEKSCTVKEFKDFAEALNKASAFFI